MPITDLSLDAKYVTIVFDNLRKEKSDYLIQQYSDLFRSTELCYLKEELFSINSENASSELYSLLNKRINELHDLLVFNGYFNLVFYEDIDSLTETRLDRIEQFISQMKIRLGQTQVFSYLIVCKDNQFSKEAMHKMDSCVERFLKENLNVPRLIIMDTKPLMLPDAWLKATVRALYLLSRQDNPIGEAWRARAPELWNWTMTEFDVQAGQKQAYLKELLQIQKGNDIDGFPKAELGRNLNKIKEQIEKQIVFPRAEEVPVPENVIGCFFKRNKLRDNAATFERILRKTFEENYNRQLAEKIDYLGCQKIWDMLTCSNQYNSLPVLNSEKGIFEWEQECKEVLSKAKNNKIALQHWNKIPEYLQGMEELFHCRRIVSIQPAGNVSDIRYQAKTAFKIWADEAKEFLSENIGCVLRRKLTSESNFISSQIQSKQQILAREEHKLKTEASINIKSSLDYLVRASELNEEGFSIKCLRAFEKNDYLLISEDINNNWTQAEESVKSVKDVYNLHNLGDYEFQTLTLRTLRKQEYNESKYIMFDQMEAAE